MPKYFILYTGSLTGNTVFNTDENANCEQDARAQFEGTYPMAGIERIRKGRPFSKKEIHNLQTKLRHA